MNEIDPEVKADFIAYVIFPVLLALAIVGGVRLYKAVQPEPAEIRIPRNEFGHR